MDDLKKCNYKICFKDNINVARRTNNSVLLWPGQFILKRTVSSNPFKS